MCLCLQGKAPGKVLELTQGSIGSRQREDACSSAQHCDPGGECRAPPWTRSNASISSHCSTDVRLEHAEPFPSAEAQTSRRHSCCLAGPGAGLPTADSFGSHLNPCPLVLLLDHSPVANGQPGVLTGCLGLGESLTMSSLRPALPQSPRGCSALLQLGRRRPARGL